MASLLDAARELSAAPRPDVFRVSAFVDLDPSVVPTGAALSSHVGSVVDEARRAESALPSDLSHDAKMAVRDDVQRIVHHLQGDLDRSGARGYAVYASSPEDLFRSLPLPTPVRDGARVAHSFVVAPLLGAVERERTLVLVAVGRERGTIWRRTNDRLSAVEDLTEPAQRRHDQGGWSQANFQRSRDKDALDHMKEVAHELERLVAPGSPSLVVVACTAEERPDFERQLAPHVRDALLGWASVEAHDDGTALAEEAEQLLDDRRRDEHRQLLDRWHEADGRDGRASAGWHEVMGDAWDGAIGTLLTDGRTRDAWECPECGRGRTDAGPCNVDGSATEPYPDGALDVALRGTLAHGGEARLVDEGLAELEVAALLRFPSPTR